MFRASSFRPCRSEEKGKAKFVVSNFFLFRNRTLTPHIQLFYPEISRKNVHFCKGDCRFQIYIQQKLPSRTSTSGARHRGCSALSDRALFIFVQKIFFLTIKKNHLIDAWMNALESENLCVDLLRVERVSAHVGGMWTRHRERRF